MKVKVPPDSVGGDVDEGYGKVADVFRRNIASGQEIGATVAVYRDGVKVAASRGPISYDAKVADHWPEFAQAGKQSVTVRQLLSHQAGLPVLDQPVTLDDLADPAKTSAKFAAQAPAWRFPHRSACVDGPQADCPPAWLVEGDELRTVEIPASNGVGTARSIAKLCGCAASGGTESV